ncbi:MAG TPA: peptide chain release factor N(5)-glutamine methyltransferase [Caldimonas sp.]|nr:peptide chain release factor N(5)-glutamine methyltransferase [Caldimonas sp.]HEV7577115.1 peptide chain release factor N(5)-glutamine methyltransferase [Caldimonas sp.]
MTVAAALAAARARGVAALDGQLLLARLLATTRTRLISADERTLSRAEARQWSAWLERRLAGEPVAYLLGEKEFHGLLLEVDADVLVPRPETELLVDWASELIAALTSTRSGADDRPGRGADGPPLRGAGDRPGRGADDRRIRAIDLGTGSGAIALALKRAHPGAAVVASDVSPAALAIARRNAERLGLAIELVEASWWHGLEGRRFELAVANPPYIAAGDPHLAALRHEPLASLTPGGDGLGALREVIAGARSPLVSGGWLLVEHGFDQGAAVRDLLATAGFAAIATRRDLAGLERTTGGRRPAD